VPAVALTALQACSTTMMTGAIVPQIVSNFRSRSSGGWSPVTAALCVAGNMARVFTTAQQTGDRLLLCGFAVGATLQATLLTQCLLFR
jgi:mannose-P-dolichol utilization defect protein 1